MKIRPFEKEKMNWASPQKIVVPGSKSITNRFFPLALFAEKPVQISGALHSEDTEIMETALIKMGATLSHLDNGNIEIFCGNFFENTEELEIFCGNSGTTLRFLASVCALRNGNTILTGIERMKKRPIGDLIDALGQMGVKAEFLEHENFPPIKIFGVGKHGLSGGNVEISGKASSQFLTSLFHIAPFCQDGLCIKIADELVSKPYANMTLSILEQCGIFCENKNFEEFIFSPQSYKIPEILEVEADASSASYPLAIAALTGGSVKISHLPKKSLQGDAQFFEKVICKMLPEGEKKLQPLGIINLEDMPDVAMTAAILCAYADGYSRIEGLSTLRHKECDRIFALESNLQKMGATVNAGEDVLEIWGNPKALHGADIECFNDHRVAMCFGVLGSVIEGVNILDPNCVKKTYPNFWEDLEKWRN